MDDSDPRPFVAYMMYEEGRTLAEVGEHFGVTRERVRQWFAERDLPTRTKQQANRIRASKLYESIDSEEVRRAYLKLGSVDATAKELGISRKAVKLIVDESVPVVERRFSGRVSQKRHTDSELLEFLRSAAVSMGGEVMSANAYNRWAADRETLDGRPVAKSQTFRNRFGSWRDALIAAGLPANDSSPISGRRIPDEVIVDAVRECARVLGDVPTVSQYERLSMAHGWPSAVLVRTRLGSWLDALERAGLVIGGRYVSG